VEEQLRASEREFRTLAENAPDNIARYDRQCRAICVNPALLQTLGLAASDMLGKTPNETFPDGRFRDYQAMLEKILADGQNSAMEITVPDGCGGELYCHIRFVAERGQDGAIIGVLSIGRDITERKRAELERQAQTRSLECMEQVHKAILEATDLEQAMNDVLDVVLSIFDCDRAFLIYPCDPDAVEWQVPMERTQPEYPGALALGKPIPMGETVARMMRIMLDADGPVTFGPGAEYSMLPDVSEQFSIKSMMAMTSS